MVYVTEDEKSIKKGKHHSIGVFFFFSQRIAYQISTEIAKKLVFSFMNIEITVTVLCVCIYIYEFSSLMI